MSTVKSEELWNQWVSSFERFMDGADGFLYGAYRVVRWPVAGLWELGRGFLQWANILSEPEVAPAPPKHLVVDFRGAWYTGTSLMNRFGPTRRFYQWFRSWYCMGEGRLKRWYGEGYRFEEVTFQGRLHGNTAYYLFDRLEKLREYRLPGYHLVNGERPQLPAKDALCRVHFKGDYDLASAQGLGLVLYDVWRKHYPIAIKPSASGREPAYSSWYTIPLDKRIALLKVFKSIATFGMLSEEHNWICKRFKVTHKEATLHQDDVASLPGILKTVDSYLDGLMASWRVVHRDLNETAEIHQIGCTYNMARTRQPHSTSFWYRIGYDWSLSWMIDKQGKRDIRSFLRKAGSDVDSSREIESADLSAGSQALQGEFNAAQAQRTENVQYWDRIIESEKTLGEFERTHTGFWGFWQDLFGLVRLQPKSPEGVSPEAIQGRVGDGVSGVDDSMAPAGGPDNDKSRAVFPEPQQPPTREHTVPEVDSGIGALPVTPPV